jgi:hypothetical protein
MEDPLRQLWRVAPLVHGLIDVPDFLELARTQSLEGLFLVARTPLVIPVFQGHVTDVVEFGGQAGQQIGFVVCHGFSRRVAQPRGGTGVLRPGSPPRRLDSPQNN